MLKFCERLNPRNWKSKVTVPVVRLSGIVASAGMLGAPRHSFDLKSVEPALKKAFSYKKAPAIAIVINSPGGSPVQSRQILNYIRQLAQEKNKTVITFAEDVAASGGYFIAIAGDEIIVDPSSIVGSIGVISAGFGFVELLDKIGVERRIHTAGTKKRTLDPFVPENPDDIEHLKELQLDIHRLFIDTVKERRGEKLNQDSKDLFSGLFWSGTKAVELGLADKLGGLYQEIATRFGSDAQIKEIAVRKKGFLSLLPKMGLGYNDPGWVLSLFDEIKARVLWMRFGY